MKHTKIIYHLLRNTNTAPLLCRIFALWQTCNFHDAFRELQQKKNGPLLPSNRPVPTQTINQKTSSFCGSSGKDTSGDMQFPVHSMLRKPVGQKPRGRPDFIKIFYFFIAPGGGSEKPHAKITNQTTRSLFSTRTKLLQRQLTTATAILQPFAQS